MGNAEIVGLGEQHRAVVLLIRSYGRVPANSHYNGVYWNGKRIWPLRGRSFSDSQAVWIKGGTDGAVLAIGRSMVGD